MIDILEGWIFREQDMLAIRYGRNSNGKAQGWYVGVILRGTDKPVTSPLFQTEEEMREVLDGLKAAWSEEGRREPEKPQETTEADALLAKMEERIRETDRMLEAMRRDNERRELEAQRPKKAGKAGKAGKKAEKKKLDKEEALRIVEDAGLRADVEEGLKIWLDYKYEKRQAYQPTGLKALVTKARNYARDYGAEAVLDVLTTSMSSGYQGIVWDRLKKPSPKGGASGKFGEFEQNDYDFEALESELAAGAGGDDEEKERAGEGQEAAQEALLV